MCWQSSGEYSALSLPGPGSIFDQGNKIPQVVLYSQNLKKKVNNANDLEDRVSSTHRDLIQD